jgi:hypothetical protein
MKRLIALLALAIAPLAAQQYDVGGQRIVAITASPGGTIDAGYAAPYYTSGGLCVRIGTTDTCAAPKASPIFTGQPTIPDFTLAGHTHANTANGGQLTDAALSAAVGVAKGGTGRTSLTLHGVLLGNNTSGVTQLAAAGLDTVLMGGGASADPSFVSLVNCANDGAHATVYSTSTHAFACAAISGGGGGTGNAGAIHTTNITGTPTLACASASAGTMDVFKLTLTGNVSGSYTISGCTSGQIVAIDLCQGGTTHSWTAPTNLKGLDSIAATAHYCTAVVATYDGTNIIAGTAYVYKDDYSAILGDVEIQDGAGGTTTLQPSTGTITLTLPALSGTLALKNASDLTPPLYAAGGGTANAQTVALSPAASTLAAGLTVRWLPTAGNTGATTLTVNSLTTKNLTKCGTTTLASGDLTTSAVAIATYDGTQFQLLNPQAATCGGGGGGGGGTVLFTTAGTGSWPINQIGVPSPINSGSGTNNVYYVEFVLPGSATVRHLISRQGADSSGKHYTFSILDSSENLVTNAQCSTLSSDPFTSQVCDFAGDVALSGGTYFIGWSTDEDGGSPTMAMYGTTNTTADALTMNAGAVPRVFRGSNKSTGTSTITMPSSIGTRTALNSTLLGVVLIP